MLPLFTTMLKTAAPAMLKAALICLVVFLQRPGDGTTLDATKRKAIETLAEDWFKARPATPFENWNDAARAKLLERAKALDPVPEGSVREIRHILWKAARKHGQKLDATKPLETRFGKAAFSVVNAPSGDGTKTGLLIGLHGGGEGAGDKSEAQGTWSAPLSKYKLMGVFPQAIHLVHDAWNTVEGERFLLALIEMAKRTHDVDPDRVFFAGFSMGGTGSWFMAGRHPHLLAGALPFHGVIFAQPDNQSAVIERLHHGLVPNIRHVPLYYTTGSIDKNCKPYSYEFAEKLLDELRAKHKGEYVTNFRCVEGLAHAYPPGEPQKAFDWMLNRRRVTFPKSFTWENAREIQSVTAGDRVLVRDFYWLRCEDPADYMQIEAGIEGQEIRLDIKRHVPSGFTVYLTKELVDTGKEVTLKVNGGEKFRGVLQPSLAAMLTSMADRFDRNAVYERKIEF